MARKTDEQRLREAENQIKKIRAKIKKEQAKFRHEAADEILRAAEQASGVTITNKNFDTELPKIKERLSSQTSPLAENDEKMKSIKDLIDFISNVLGHSVTAADILKTKEFLTTQEERGNWFSNFMNR